MHGCEDARKPYQSLRKVRKVATNALLPTSSLDVVGLCFSTHSWPPADAPAPPLKAPLPLLLGPADAPADLAPNQHPDAVQRCSTFRDVQRQGTDCSLQQFGHKPLEAVKAERQKLCSHG